MNLFYFKNKSFILSIIMSSFTTNNENTTIKPKQFNVKALSFTDVVPKYSNKNQENRFPRYSDLNNKNFYLQISNINNNSGGFPPPDDTGKDAYIRITIDNNNPELEELGNNVLKPIDEKFGSNEFKQQLFGNKWKKYKYVPCYRTPKEDEDEDNEENKKKGPKLPYFKVNIDTNYSDNKVKTGVFTLSFNEDNKKIKTKVNDIETIDDLRR